MVEFVEMDIVLLMNPLTLALKIAYPRVNARQVKLLIVPMMIAAMNHGLAMAMRIAPIRFTDVISPVMKMMVEIVTIITLVVMAGVPGEWGKTLTAALKIVMAIK